MKKIKLTQIGVQRLKEKGTHADGAGLYLNVTETGTKSWLLRYTLNKRARWMGLGGYPEVSLLAAREKAASYRVIIKSGIDPLDGKREERQKAHAAAANRINFSKAAHEYIESHKSGWKNAKHIDQWRTSIKDYADGIIGSLDVSLIEVAHIVRIMQQNDLWTTKTETATRLRGRLEKIIDWATVRGFRKGENPARWKGNLEALLPAPGKVQKRAHFPAMAYKQMADFMPKLQAMGGTAARAVEFLILTATRSGEVRGARWEEVDLKEKVWTIPAERMKMKKEHRIPLSDAAIKVLQKMVPQEAGLIFQGREKNGEVQALSDMTLSAVLRRMEYKTETIHGFRSSFRDWGAELTDYPSEVLEMALAHKVANSVERAYRRGDLFEKRNGLMSDWAKFCGVEK
jgi:integrase